MYDIFALLAALAALQRFVEPVLSCQMDPYQNLCHILAQETDVLCLKRRNLKLVVVAMNNILKFFAFISFEMGFNFHGNSGMMLSVLIVEFLDNLITQLEHMLEIAAAPAIAACLLEKLSV